MIQFNYKKFFVGVFWLSVSVTLRAIQFMIRFVHRAEQLIG